MRRALLALGVAAVALTVLLPGAFGRTQDTPGVTARTITLGGTFPLSGPASSYAPIPVGMAMYFSWVNAHKGPDGKRGVGGRQILWKYYDDGYNPANTVQRTRQLVEQDHVFALIGGLGTEPQLAVRDYLNAQKVPQAYVSTGATTFGADQAKYPWTLGWQPDYQAESAIYGKYIAKNQPNAKIGVIYQNDAYGKDYIAGLEEGLGAKKSQIVATRGFEVTDPSVLSQVLDLRKAGVNTLMIFATPSPTIKTYATMAKVGWKPDNIYVNSVSATQTFMGIAVQLAGAAEVNGSVSTYYLKDPANPSWAKDAGMKMYMQVMAKYGPTLDPKNGLYLYGMAKAYDAVAELRKTGANLTRASFMHTVLNSTITGNPFALPNVRTTTGPKDHFPISQQQLIKFGDGQWTPFGQLVDPRGKS
jgi:branched-chain amino acid transport system substrate-binding protein